MKILEQISKQGEKRLPICFPPPITSYLPYSVLSAIICGTEKSNNWIYNNFIQLYFNGIGKVDYYPNSDFAYHDKLCLSSTELNQLNYQMNYKSIISDMKFWIDNGNYVSCYLAESKIPGTRFYNCSDIIHSQFIFGYSDERQIFYLSNFGKTSKKLEIMEVKYEDFLYALEYTISCNKERKYLATTTMKDIGKDFRIILLHYNQTNNELYSSKICIEYIRQQISDLLEEKNSSLHNVYFSGLQSGQWGLSTYEVIKEKYRNGRN